MSAAESLTATVIVPTTIDRGPTLTLAVESVLRQTVADLEVFIIGDGVQDITRDAAHALERADRRVRFFDHPKHPRRGEPHRHEALAHARGRIVCYLVDRDLYLPDHVQEMAELLRDADMAHSFLFKVGTAGYWLKTTLDLSDAADRSFLARQRVGIPLGHGAHTLDAYRRLHEGWASTPEGFVTDGYFWSKFARDPAMRCVSGWRPTVLNFPRGTHPGWSTQQRLQELRGWAARIQDAHEVEAIRREVMLAALHDRAQRCRLLREPVLVEGAPARFGAWLQFGVKRLKHLWRSGRKRRHDRADTDGV